MEPLLKDEEEKLVVAPDNKLVPTKKHKAKKEKPPFKWDRNVIITIILAIFILWFFGKNIVQPFYMGFKYYDQVHGEKETDSGEEVTNNEEDIAINSSLVTNTYNKIYIDNCINTDFIRNKIYSNTLVNNLNNIEKTTILLNYYNYNYNYNNLGHDTFTITLDELNNLGIFIFNDSSFILASSGVYGNYQLTYDEVNNNFTVTLFALVTCLPTINRSITKATTLNDELYIYETVNNTNYKWTFKKGNDNNYYFVSITPE